MGLTNAERQQRFRERQAAKLQELKREAAEVRYVTDPRYPRLIRDLEALYKKFLRRMHDNPNDTSVANGVLFNLRRILDDAKPPASEARYVTGAGIDPEPLRALAKQIVKRRKAKPAQRRSKILNAIVVEREVVKLIDYIEAELQRVLATVPATADRYVTGIDPALVRALATEIDKRRKAQEAQRQSRPTDVQKIELLPVLDYVENELERILATVT
jgi:hypothetical protein